LLTSFPDHFTALCHVLVATELGVTWDWG